MAKYKKIKDGEGFEVPALTPYPIACCDCGLVHDFAFAASKDGKTIGIAARRNNRATAAMRRQSKNKSTTK